MTNVSGTKGRCRVRVVLAIGAMAVVGCGDDPTRDCRESGGVELCLVDDKPSYELTGKGFRPESEVWVSVVDDVHPPRSAAPDTPPVRISADGALPGSGEKWMALQGPVPQRLTARGTASDGSAVEFHLTIPPRAR